MGFRISLVWSYLDMITFILSIKNWQLKPFFPEKAKESIKNLFENLDSLKSPLTPFIWQTGQANLDNYWIMMMIDDDDKTKYKTI